MVTSMRVTREDVQRAQARVGLRQDAVAWGLTFAQADLSGLLPGERQAFQCELHAFVHHPPRGITSKGDDRRVDLFDLDLTEAQQILLRTFRLAADREPIDTPLRGTPRAVWFGDRYTLVQYDNELDLTPAEQLQAAAVRLLDRLPPRYVINACEAPRLRQREPCGNLFLTKKSTQRYCSITCQQRAHHRRNRRPRRPAPA